MAIDTQTKRRSVLGAFMVALTVLPLPDGAVGTQDRPHVNGLYAGIVVSVVTIPDICGPLFSALQDPTRVSSLVDPERESVRLDPMRVSDLECD